MDYRLEAFKAHLQPDRPARNNELARLLEQLDTDPKAEARILQILNKAETVTKAAELSGISYKEAGGDEIDTVAAKFAAILTGRK